jgi:hypothetical protein
MWGINHQQRSRQGFDNKNKIEIDNFEKTAIIMCGGRGKQNLKEGRTCK